MSLQSCNNNTVELVKSQMKKSVKLINVYRWIIDAYISDFFTDGLWDRLPEGWTEGLSQLDSLDLAFLLDSSLPIPNRKDLPLTLLAFRESTHALSLDRQKVDLENKGIGEGLFPLDKDKERKAVVSPHSGVTTQTKARADIQFGQYLPLNACFRTHVKPKKQHEILQLGKAIQLLGSGCSCDHVVDVGAGQGHLSRLLAFGHGFKVTTVEAAGCHAPKAEKMDKDIQKKIHRKLKRKHPTEQEQASVDGSKEDTTASNTTSLPDHVTCLIQPGTSAEKFLEVVRDSYRKQTDVLDIEGQGRVPNQDPSNMSTGSRSPNSKMCSKHLKSEKTNSPRSQNIETDCINSPVDSVDTKVTQPGPGINCVRDLSQFVLTGLHACGDLTPTMLRIFVQCPDIVGVASVACCYMKLSCREGGADEDSGDLGYPMSQFTANLKDNHLSFEARAMACHFADSYKERLLANPPSLKLHCYRAALQYIIKEVYPDFSQGSIRLSIKHSDTMTFESYVKTSLRRLGLDPDVPVQVLQQAQSYLPCWQKVVAFYTLRLSLAPVVESLILLDRMLYLYEQGIPSVLLPIFDPALSPRNFVLLASRKCSVDITTS